MRRTALVCALAVALTASVGTPTSAFGQTEAELAAARKLFTEAVKDEEKKDFERALQKFRKVQEVKDTPAVRFRIAACSEALNHLKDARDAYASVVDAAANDPAQADLASAARERLSDIERKLPAVTLLLSPHAPADAKVTLDDHPVDRAQIGHAIPLEPGDHTVKGEATGVAPFATQLQLKEGARVTISIPLDPPAQPQPIDQTPKPIENHSSSAQSTWGWVLVGSGGALIAVSAVSFIVRSNAIGTMEDNCPNNRCPESTRDEVLSARDRAQLMMPIGVLSGLVGVVAASTGVILLATDDGKPERTQPPKPAPAPGASPSEAGALRLFVAPTHSGGVLTLGSRF